MLANPIVDKALAVVIVSPIAYGVFVLLRDGELDFVRIQLILQGLLNVIPMLLRRPPSRVSLNPVYWVVSFMASFWIPFPALETSPGVMIVPRWLGVTLSCLGLVLTVYARLSLGRNIGMVPAQRHLVTTGAYRFVRHPIYTAIFVSFLSLLLLHYSALHLVLVSYGIVLILIRSIMEERFLATDPEYASYMDRVPHRWIPGVV